MRRVVIVGSAGAGKSTLAGRLAERTGLPLVHLDAEYWRPGWVPTPPDEWAARVEQLAAADEWILDGNYSGTIDRRLARADTAVFLDVPTAVCLAGITRRRLALKGGTRADMAPGCPDKLDRQFVWWVATYRRRSRPRVLAALDRFAGEVVILHDRGEVDRWLDRVPHGR